MTAPAPRIVRVTSLLILLPFAAALGADEAVSPTKAIQSQVDAVKKQQMVAQKKMALKKAAIDVAKKRVAELQKQLKSSQERVVSESKAFEAAQKDEAAKAKQVASLIEQLKKHQHADGLLAVAAKAKATADAARNEHKSLADAAADLKSKLFDQQQRFNKATAKLKETTEQLPKTLEELKKARATYDALGKEVDTARLAVNDARKAARTQKAAVQPEQSRYMKANAALAQVTASIKSLSESLVALQAAAKTAGTNPAEAGAELTKSIAAVKPLQARATALVAAAKNKMVAVEKQAATANAVLKAAQDKLREHQNKFAEQSRAHFKLQLSVADLQNAEKLHQKQIADAKTQQEQIAAKQKAMAPKVAAALATVEKLDAEYVAKQQVAEKDLESLNRFVSFSRHIAPIFAKRCVACHNTRTASGRLNMDSFAGLKKGGESGTSIEAHDAAASLLWTMVDDESMPKDADPLSKEEVALIKKWIDVGAPLDAGVLASAELFQVMPEIPQPLPPKTYRVPIPVTATAFNADASILASSVVPRNSVVEDCGWEFTSPNHKCRRTRVRPGVQ